jgi:rRNA-processing protein FCF1
VRRTVLLDTNALFLPLRTGFPLEAEIGRLVPGARIVVPASSLRELDRLEGRSTPHAAGARALAERFEIVAVDAEGDDGVLKAARRERAVVVTADLELQGRARAAGLAVLVPRDRHRLELHRERAARQ